MSAYVVHLDDQHGSLARTAHSTGHDTTLIQHESGTNFMSIMDCDIEDQMGIECRLFGQVSSSGILKDYVLQTSQEDPGALH